MFPVDKCAIRIPYRRQSFKGYDSIYTMFKSSRKEKRVVKRSNKIYVKEYVRRLLQEINFNNF